MVDGSNLTLKAETIDGSNIPTVCDIITNTGFEVFGSVYHVEFAKSTTGEATLEFKFPPKYNNYIAISIHAYSYLSNGYHHDRIIATCNGLPSIRINGVNQYVTNSSIVYSYSSCTYSDTSTSNVNYGMKYNGSLVDGSHDFIPLSNSSVHVNFNVGLLYSRSTSFRIDSINILYF